MLYFSTYRPLPHSCKQRHHVEAWVDNTVICMKLPTQASTSFFMFSHWSGMRERSIPKDAFSIGLIITIIVIHIYCPDEMENKLTELLLATECAF